MTDFRQRIETTYADLRPTDLVIDKTGKAWPIDELVFASLPDQPVGNVIFWLCDPVTKVKMHSMFKVAKDSVTVSRLPTQADEAAKLEAEFDTNRNVYVGAVTDEAPPLPDHLRMDAAMTAITDSFATMDEAVAAVEEIGGTVEAEVTAEEVDAAHAATDDAPVRLPAFESMTPLEQRSHQYLLHGVYAADLKSRDELAAMHDEAHAAQDAGRLKSQYVPHVHEEA